MGDVNDPFRNVDENASGSGRRRRKFRPGMRMKSLQVGYGEKWGLGQDRG